MFLEKLLTPTEKVQKLWIDLPDGPTGLGAKAVRFLTFSSCVPPSAAKPLIADGMRTTALPCAVEVHHVDPGVGGDARRAEILRPADEGLEAGLEVAGEDRLRLLRLDLLRRDRAALEPRRVAGIGVDEAGEVEARLLARRAAHGERVHVGDAVLGETVLDRLQRLLQLLGGLREAR